MITPSRFEMWYPDMADHPDDRHGPSCAQWHITFYVCARAFGNNAGSDIDFAHSLSISTRLSELIAYYNLRVSD